MQIVRVFSEQAVEMELRRKKRKKKLNKTKIIQATGKIIKTKQ
jgi:hypothetical protein